MAFTKEYFDEGIYRMGTRCEKWDELRQREGGDILPLWVADMDFPSPPAVQQALLARAAHGTYGYTEAEADDYQALIDFWARRHEVTFTREDVMMIPCVVTGIRPVPAGPDPARGRGDYPKPRVWSLPLLGTGDGPQGAGQSADSPGGRRL